MSDHAWFNNFSWVNATKSLEGNLNQCGFSSLFCWLKLHTQTHHTGHKYSKSLVGEPASEFQQLVCYLINHSASRLGGCTERGNVFLTAIKKKKTLHLQENRKQSNLHTLRKNVFRHFDIWISWKYIISHFIICKQSRKALVCFDLSWIWRPNVTERRKDATLPCGAGDWYQHWRYNGTKC